MQKIHPETGEILHRDVRQVEYTYKEQKIIVDQPGWYPAKGDEGIFNRQDMKVASKALEIMKERHKKYIEGNRFELDNAALA